MGDKLLIFGLALPIGLMIGLCLRGCGWWMCLLPWAIPAMILFCIFRRDGVL
jgi:hypothetical protein